MSAALLVTAVAGLVACAPTFAGDCQIVGSPNPPANGEVFVAGSPTAGYDIGIDTNLLRRDWLACHESDCADCCRLTLPAGQQWGAAFITIGTAAAPPRPAQDFGEFGFLQVDLRGEVGGESVQVGVKDACDPDDGTEAKQTLTLSQDWQPFTIPLAAFGSADLHQLYVVTELVFDSSPDVETARTVFLKDVRFLPPLCGDTNNDGTITVTDGIQALRAAAELSSSCTNSRCDVNGNGEVSVSDGTLILKAAADLPIEAHCPANAGS